MARKRDGLVPIEEAISDLGGPVAAIRDASPQAVHHFTRFDQVNQLDRGQRSGPRHGFHGAPAGTVLHCPAPTPVTGRKYVRRNGPLRADYDRWWSTTKLPYGNLPRLLLAWVSTEAVQTQSLACLILGNSLAEFMRKLGIYKHDSGGSPRGDRTRLRNQMRSAL